MVLTKTENKDRLKCERPEVTSFEPFKVGAIANLHFAHKQLLCNYRDNFKGGYHG